MEHFFNAWDDFSAAVRNASHILLLSDYDGTLTPIVGRPEDALLSQAVRDKLSALAKTEKFSVGSFRRKLTEYLVGVMSSERTTTPSE